MEAALTWPLGKPMMRIPRPTESVLPLNARPRPIRPSMHFRAAVVSDLSTVSGVLRAAAAKLAECGWPLWTPAEVSESTVAPHVRDGLYHLGIADGEVIGVFRLQLQDPTFWPEIAEGTSAYLHKLAVLPQRQGQGVADQLLAHAVRLTRDKGLHFLRLDCVDGRPKLRGVYERFGFRHHSCKQLGAAVFHRYELDVTGPQVEFRAVAIGDAEDLATLRVEAMRESLERVGRFDPARARRRFLDGFSPGHTRAIVLDGEQVGFFVVRPTADGLLLDHLYVRPTHQGRGIGAEVLREVFRRADEAGQVLRVGALRGSDSNRFYLRHGFELVEQAEFDNYYVRRPQARAA